MASANKPARGVQQTELEVNPRGIPRAPFVTDVEEYVGGKDGDVEGIVKTFQETSSKYRYMELSLANRRKALSSKIPDIESTLNVVKYLQARREKATGAKGGDVEDLSLEDDDESEEKPLKTLFELNDTLYAEAELDETGEVGIWLGAQTMLLYPIPEAIELLSSKLKSANQSLTETIEDLEWLKEQVTVMEVNFARVHNWDVARRRQRKKLEEQKGSKIIESSKKDRVEDADDEED